MFFTVPFCSPVSADAPSVLLRSVSTVVEQFFKIRIQQAMTDEVASFSGGAAELNVHATGPMRLHAHKRRAMQAIDESNEWQWQTNKPDHGGLPT